MKIASASFTTQQIPLPPGSIPSGYLTWLTESSQTVEMKNIGADDRTVEFTITVPGTYMVHVVRMDATGGSIGNSASSEPFEVSEEMVDVPLVVTVQVSDGVATPKNVRVRTK